MKLKYLLERKIRIFDFDDTIASTAAKVYVTSADGKKITLTPAQYALYYHKKKKRDKFDFSDLHICSYEILCLFALSYEHSMSVCVIILTYMFI